MLVTRSGCHQAIVSDAKSQGLEAYVNLFAKSGNEADSAILQNRSRDHFSHFILRLAYSRTDDLRRWFVGQETDVFKLKLMQATPQEISRFMSVHELRYGHLCIYCTFSRTILVASK